MFLTLWRKEGISSPVTEGQGSQDFSSSLLSCGTGCFLGSQGSLDIGDTLVFLVLSLGHAALQRTECFKKKFCSLQTYIYYRGI